MEELASLLKRGLGLKQGATGFGGLHDDCGQTEGGHCFIAFREKRAIFLGSSASRREVERNLRMQKTPGRNRMLQATFSAG